MTPRQLLAADPFQSKKIQDFFALIEIISPRIMDIPLPTKFSDSIDYLALTTLKWALERDMRFDAFDIKRFEAKDEAELDAVNKAYVAELKAAGQEDEVNTKIALVCLDRELAKIANVKPLLTLARERSIADSAVFQFEANDDVDDDESAFFQFEADDVDDDEDEVKEHVPPTITISNLSEEIKELCFHFLQRYRAWGPEGHKHALLQQLTALIAIKYADHINGDDLAAMHHSLQIILESSDLEEDEQQNEDVIRKALRSAITQRFGESTLKFLDLEVESAKLDEVGLERAYQLLKAFLIHPPLAAVVADMAHRIEQLEVESKEQALYPAIESLLTNRDIRDALLVQARAQTAAEHPVPPLFTNRFIKTALDVLEHDQHARQGYDGIAAGSMANKRQYEAELAAVQIELAGLNQPQAAHAEEGGDIERRRIINTRASVIQSKLTIINTVITKQQSEYLTKSRQEAFLAQIVAFPKMLTFAASVMYSKAVNIQDHFALIGDFLSGKDSIFSTPASTGAASAAPGSQSVFASYDNGFNRRASPHHCHSNTASSSASSSASASDVAAPQQPTSTTNNSRP